MKSMKQAAVVAGFACLVVMPLAGQQPTSGGQQPTSTPQAPAMGSMGKTADRSMAGALSAADKKFVTEAAIGGMAEVEMGKMAADKASSADVKAFGQRMVDDHSKANDELKAFAAQKSVTLPAALDATHKAKADQMGKLSGAAFDRAYVREMVADHNKDVAAFKHASTTAADADLKAWAAKTLPTLEAHQTSIKEISAKMMTATSGTSKTKSK
jgi:putative membrane protein